VALRSAFQAHQQTSLPNVAEVVMWNRFMSSPYAHFITAIALTLGLVFGLLTDNPGKSSLAKFDADAVAVKQVPRQ
jgi:hypothetical protein